MTREEGQEDMLIDNISFVDFQGLPHALLLTWSRNPTRSDVQLKHPACDQSYFGQREFSFTLDGDIYLRFQSFNSVSELENSIKEKSPVKINIGPVYSVDPAKRHAYAQAVIMVSPQWRGSLFLMYCYLWVIEIRGDRSLTFGNFNGLRSPEVEEEKTKASIERKWVTVRDLEHLVDKATSRQVASSLRLDRRVISALLAVSYDSGPWEGCTIGAAVVGRQLNDLDDPEVLAFNPQSSNDPKRECLALLEALSSAMLRYAQFSMSHPSPKSSFGFSNGADMMEMWWSRSLSVGLCERMLIRILSKYGINILFAWQVDLWRVRLPFWFSKNQVWVLCRALKTLMPCTILLFYPEILLIPLQLYMWMLGARSKGIRIANLGIAMEA
ncbi:hypothetical protein TEA_021640 [Camellia sinensis var. sinensis]|uniref:Uncharacterized protein n=1 Tax=Camellia sinensis var. sinensis TaxID=542762 RepID=A0A4S4EGU1_CAMSN|nr:hypothetical protein TEA_021640 [Camellia sinensis var. sinensis]